MGRYRVSNRYVVEEVLSRLDRLEQEILLEAFDALVENPDTPHVRTFPLRGDQFGRDRMIAELPMGWYLVFKVFPHGIMPSATPCISVYALTKLDDL